MRTFHYLPSQLTNGRTAWGYLWADHGAAAMWIASGVLSGAVLGLAAALLA